jgi:hypothetical protein
MKQPVMYCSLYVSIRLLFTWPVIELYCFQIMVVSFGTERRPKPEGEPAVDGERWK